MKDKKFSTVETLLALMITIPLDILELVSGSIITFFLNFLINPLVWFVFFMWFWIKGGHYGRMVIRLVIWMASNVFELIPVLSVIPLRTIAASVAIWMINSPKELEGLEDGDLKGVVKSKFKAAIQSRTGGGSEDEEDAEGGEEEQPEGDDEEEEYPLAA